MFCVYKHTCPNGKVYIGITCRKPKERWCNGYGYMNNAHFYNAILKYGWNNIQHDILYSDLTQVEAEQKEIELIKQYKSSNRNYGYNVANGGMHNGKTSKETKEKMRLAHIGKHLTHEHKMKIRKAIEKEKHPNYNKHLKQETKNKISNAHKKKVLCIETQVVYESGIEAGKKMNLCNKNICACCIGKQKSHKGYHFKYL